MVCIVEGIINCFSLLRGLYLAGSSFSCNGLYSRKGSLIVSPCSEVSIWRAVHLVAMVCIVEGIINCFSLLRGLYLAGSSFSCNGLYSRRDH